MFGPEGAHAGKDPLGPQLTVAQATARKAQSEETPEEDRIKPVSWMDRWSSLLDIPAPSLRMNVRAWTALHAWAGVAGAALEDHSHTTSADVVKALTACGADLNVKGDNGETPLMVALATGDVHVAKVCLICRPSS